MPSIAHPRVTIADLAGRHFAEVWKVASIFEVDARTIRKDIKAGKIPHTKVAREYRIPVAWILTQAGASA